MYFITDKIIQVQYLHAKEGDDIKADLYKVFFFFFPFQLGKKDATNKSVMHRKCSPMSRPRMREISNRKKKMMGKKESAQQQPRWTAATLSTPTSPSL